MSSLPSRQPRPDRGGGHPPVAAAVLIVAVLIIIIGLAAWSTFR